MLRAMILIVLIALLLITIVTQIVLPMFTDKLEFFWYFKKGSRDDIIIPAKDEDLYDQAQDATKQYKHVKDKISRQRQKLKKLDKETDV
ncbi:MAG: hypothetical protein KDC07_09125 [Chitinophagaceae bacterium]|nr:hypothetical protein [Chitinophagaceae bacterium]MCB9047178.1 hypothetical protein [Chitinophagales bacterium]